jgi:hypothetical protein
MYVICFLIICLLYISFNLNLENNQHYTKIIIVSMKIIEGNLKIETIVSLLTMLTNTFMDNKRKGRITPFTHLAIIVLIILMCFCQLNS